jgi:hypothetical protein
MASREGYKAPGDGGSVGWAGRCDVGGREPAGVGGKRHSPPKCASGKGRSRTT